MLPLKRIPPDRLETLLAIARTAPLADRSLDYPGWYTHRWHYLPEGYLSRRSVRLYDRLVRPLYHALVEPRSHEAVAAIVRRIGPREVLELGCGPGRALRAAGRAAGQGARLTGVDLSPYMLELAKRRLGEHADLWHANATDLPFPAGRFDLAIALHVLGHMPRSEAGAALAEAMRVLRPGGWLLTVEHRWHRIPWPGPLRLVQQRPAGLGFAVLRLHRWHATAGEALASVRQSASSPTTGEAP